MKNSAFLLGLVLYCATPILLSAQSILDIGLFNIPVNSNKLEVRIRPTQTITNGVYSAGIFTVRVLASSGVTLTAPAALNTPLYSYTLQGQGSDGTYNYFIFAVVSIKTVNWNAGVEYPIAILQFNASCSGTATFEIINNAWTAAHNGNYYQELNGLEAHNLIWQATATAPLGSGPPNINCTVNQTATTNNNLCSHTHPDTDWNATGSASCPGSMINYVLSGASSGSYATLAGAVFAKGLTTVTATITDNGGLTASCTFTVTVTDAQNPTVTAPLPVTAIANAAGCSATGVTLGIPVAADNCSIASVTNNAPGTFPPGTTTVTWTVTDGAGLTAIATQIVTVQSNLAMASAHLADPQLCTGAATDLSFSISGGVGPYTVVYNDGGGNTTLANYGNNQLITVAPTTTTTYQLLQVTDALGCSFSPLAISATLVVHPYPVIAHVLPPTMAVCAGTPVSFYADGLLPNAVTTFTYLVNGQPVTTTATTDASGNVTFPPAGYPAGTNSIVVTAVTVHGCTTNTNLGTSFEINSQSAACNLSLGGKVANEAGSNLDDANIQITGSGPGIPSFALNALTTGIYLFQSAIPPTSDVLIKPTKDDNPLNGVTTFDLVLISRHILGLAPLGSLYKMIAADANHSGSLTTFDIVELRKLILGIYTKLPNNTSWRFVDASYVFPNSANPFASMFPETRMIANMGTDHLQENFVAIKVGDVNGSALANFASPADDRTTGQLVFETMDRVVEAGEVFTLRFRATEKVLGYQFTLHFHDLELRDILPGPHMTLENFGWFPQAVTTSFDGDQAGAFELTFRAVTAGRISDKMEISSAITRAEAYGPTDDRLEVVLRFQEGLSAKIAGQGFELYQNLPNPFMDQTVIRFYLPEAAGTTLTVFDDLGRVRWQQSVDLPKGNNAFEVDGGVLGGPGTFYYQVKTATDAAVRKMIYQY